MFVSKKKYQELQEAYERRLEKELRMNMAENMELLGLNTRIKEISAELNDAKLKIDEYKQKYVDELQKRLELAEKIQAMQKKEE